MDSPKRYGAQVEIQMTSRVVETDPLRTLTPASNVSHKAQTTMSDRALNRPSIRPTKTHTMQTSAAR